MMNLKNSKVVVYGRPSCMYCENAKSLLESHNINYVYVDVYKDDTAKAMIMEEGHRTVPQIYVDHVHLGGFAELNEILNEHN